MSVAVAARVKPDLRPQTSDLRPLGTYNTARLSRTNFSENPPEGGFPEKFFTLKPRSRANSLAHTIVTSGRKTFTVGYKTITNDYNTFTNDDKTAIVGYKIFTNARGTFSNDRKTSTNSNKNSSKQWQGVIDGEQR